MRSSCAVEYCLSLALASGPRCFIRTYFLFKNCQVGSQCAAGSSERFHNVARGAASRFSVSCKLSMGSRVSRRTLHTGIDDEISNRDDIHVLLFLESKVFVRAVILPRHIAEFSKTILLQPISRGQANFKRAAKGNEFVLGSSRQPEHLRAQIKGAS